MTENTIRSVKILSIIEECVGVKTLTFKNVNTKIPKPGQFIMVWVPGVDEIPMSISGCDSAGNWFITVKNVGECTNAIHNLKVGDFIGVRGPLGNWFKLPEDMTKKIFLVSGGIGTAPIKFLATKLDDSKIKFHLIKGTKNSNEAIFVKDFQNFNHSNSDINFCTEVSNVKSDASNIKNFYDSKFVGYPHDRLESLINKYLRDGISNFIVYACGPEIMTYKVFQICQKYNIELNASLERVMRCGCGLCGLCSIDPLGLLVCKDGPVFSSKDLRRMEDFGKYRRDFTGKKILIN